MNIPDIIFSAGLDRALGWTVIHAIWQVTLIAFLTGILLVALRNKSAQVRYWVTNLAMIGVLATSIATFSWYARSAPDVPAATSVENAQQAAVPAIRLQAPEPPGQVQSTNREAVGATTFIDYFNRHLPLVVLIWFVGMAIFLLKLLGSLLQVYDLRLRMNFHADPYWTEVLQKLAWKSGLRQGITLLESAMIRSPLTIGHLKPVILFPLGVINRLSEQEVEAILAHELAHIIRRDYLFNVLQSLIEAIFYFHPAIWWLSAQVRNEREHACDDRAIALLGNKINYAKALVTIQEMAYYPQTPALAFAGSRKNQLLRRVQRLFTQPKTSFNLMEKWISTVLVVCLVFVLAFGQRLQNLNQSAGYQTAKQDATKNSGIWEATFSRDSVALTLAISDSDSKWSFGEELPKSSFANLNATDGETAFQLLRAAGNISFTGKIEAGAGYGRFLFTPDESYRAALVQQGFQQPDDALLMQCFWADFPADYAATVQKMGFRTIGKEELQQLAAFRLNEKAIKAYQELASTIDPDPLTFDQLIEMKVSNVTKEQVNNLAKAGYKNLSLSDISQMSMHQVDAAFIRDLKKLGFNDLSGDELIAAKIHGLDAAFINQHRNLGLDTLDFDALLDIKIHHIDSAFVNQFEGLGLGKLQFDDIMAMKVHNIDADFIRQAQKWGLGELTQEEILTLKVHNIDGDFIRQAQNLGLGKLGFDEIVGLKIHNIDANLIKQAQSMGLDHLGFDELMQIRIHNIDPAFVKKAQQIGRGKLDMGEIAALRIHNIDSEFLATCRSMDLGKLGFDDVLQMRIHNITPEMATSFREIGFKKLTVEDLVAARIHNITPDFVKEAGQKGYQFPSLSEYVDLKIQMEIGNQRKK